MDFKFKNGQKARDIVTGFTGTITARVEYLNGCIQYCLSPQTDKNGNMAKDEYLDEGQIEILPEPKKEVKAKSTGGPQRNCPPH